MSGSAQLTELLKAAYAEGVKAALVHGGYDEKVAYTESEKVAAQYPFVEFRMGPEDRATPSPATPLATQATTERPAEEAESKGILGRLLPAASIGATLGLLGGGGLRIARNPAWREKFMKILNRKKDGGVWKAVKEMAPDTAEIQRHAIPGAIGGGAVGLMGGD
jgi:hypothetical protein